MADTVESAQVADSTATDSGTASPAKASGSPSQSKSREKSSAKEIPSGLAYVNTPGLLRNVLDKIISAQKPEKLTQDYLGTVWGFKSGSARAIIPLLKRVGLLHSDGKPTESYSNFRTESQRSSAARGALRSGFPDIFQQNEHAEHMDDKELLDIVVGITGRERNDATAKAIVNTFRVFANYVGKTGTPAESIPPPSSESLIVTERDGTRPNSIGLSYQINIILPETTDIDVFDAIFRSLRTTLLR